MSDLTNKLADMKEEQRRFASLEKKAGDVVNESFHKGAMYGVTISEIAINQCGVLNIDKEQDNHFKKLLNDIKMFNDEYFRKGGTLISLHNVLLKIIEKHEGKQ